MIESKDISVVVQGAFDKVNTPLCLKSLREVLPESEIVFSTWEGTVYDGQYCDKVLLNKDPGGYVDKYCPALTNNTLRQLISTQNGINNVSGKYVLKIRSDLIFKSCDFLDFFDSYSPSSKDFKVFQHRIIFCSFFSKRFCSAGDISQPLPYHVSDWLAFGYAEDIRFLYDIKLPVEPKNSWYLAEEKYHTVKTDLLHCSHRYSSEQYIFFNACQKALPGLKFDHYLDYDRINIYMSEMIVANNCIILDPVQFEMICGKEATGHDTYKLWTQKMSTMPDDLVKGLYTNKTFEDDYKRLCK